MKIHFIVHESFESPAAVEQWAVNKKHQITQTCVYRYEKFPNNADNMDLLVIMGGPQSPNTTTEECPYFDAKAEIKLIQDAVKQNKAVLGICLGAQLLGEAFGAKVEHSPNKEIGIYPVYLTKLTSNDKLFSSFPEKIFVAHWHGDMPGLTENAEVLAYSEGCPRQIIRYKSNVYGFQCHFEFTKESVESMIQNNTADFDALNKLPYICDADFLKSYDYSEINGFLFRFLDKLETEI